MLANASNCISKQGKGRNWVTPVVGRGSLFAVVIIYVILIRQRRGSNTSKHVWHYFLMLLKAYQCVALHMAAFVFSPTRLTVANPMPAKSLISQFVLF